MYSYPSRCQHIKVNGTQCGSPALRRNRFCYFHKRHHDERIQLNADRSRTARRKVSIDLPVLENAESIQVSLTEIMRLIISGQIDSKAAGLLLYALQTASANLSRTQFQPKRHEVILDPRTVGETLLGENVWEDADFEDEEEEQQPEDDPVGAARKAGIMKAAEYLYDLDRKVGGVHGFAAKPAPPLPPDPAKPKPAQSVATATTATEPAVAAVRARITAQVKKALPGLLAANPELTRT